MGRRDGRGGAARWMARFTTGAASGACTPAHATQTRPWTHPTFRRDDNMAYGTATRALRK